MNNRKPWFWIAPCLLCAAQAAAQEDDALQASEETVALSINESSVALPTDSLARLDAIMVSEIRVAQSSVFSEAELAEMIAPYTNRSISVEELHDLRHTLSEAYVERGHVNSGVVIPDQRVSDGVITLEAIEGELTEIEVQGNRRFKDAAIKRRIERYVKAPLDINDLQASLRAIEDDPLVERVNAQLLPGEALGESHLRLGITERRPLELEVSAANDRSPNVGEDRATVGIGYRGLIGNGDVLSGHVNFTDGVNDNLLRYHVPLTSGGATLDVLVSDQQADIVEEPFDRIDIESRLETWSLTASYPFVRGYERSLSGIFGFEHKRSESTLLDLPFSFSAGDVDGKARGSAIYAGVEWTRRSEMRAWTWRSTVQVGVDAFNATQHETLPDSDFVSLLSQFQLLQQLSARGDRILARGLFQLADDPLLAMYKLPVGGRYSVRGYRENLFVRDNAMVASLEYQMPVLRDAAGRAMRSFYLAFFADYGVSWDEDERLATSRKQRIASSGLGLVWDPIPGFHAELYWGHDLDEQGNPEESLQDRGFHYGFGFQRAF